MPRRHITHNLQARTSSFLQQSLSTALQKRDDGSSYAREQTSESMAAISTPAYKHRKSVAHLLAVVVIVELLTALVIAMTTHLSDDALATKV